MSNRAAIGHGSEKRTAAMLLLLTVLPLAGCNAAEPSEAVSGFGDSPCAACISRVCNEEVLTCQGELDCQDYLTCLGRCPTAPVGYADPDCLQRCAAKVPESDRWRIDKLSACQVSNKAALSCSSCGEKVQPTRLDLALSQVCPVATPVDTSCAGCQHDNCCASKADCVNDQDCNQILTCFSSCTNPTEVSQCRAACSLMYQKGRLKLARYELCILVRCNDSCLAPTARTPGCDPCMARECPDTVLDFYSNLDCQRIIDCSALCGADPICLLENDCISANSSCDSTLNSYFGCMANRCPRVCKTDGVI